MNTRSSHVAGVDGARGGWMVARLDLDQAQITLEFRPSIATLAAELADETNPLRIVAIDMPIGLSTTGQRSADQLARARLGPRRSTFFPAPIRSVLDFDDYQDANAHSKAISGSGLSKQAWNLVPKIAEVDAVWNSDLAASLLEAHPETSFAEMSGAPVMSKKATAEGREERLELLGQHLSPQVQSLVDAAPARLSVDSIDALALTWTARRAVEGRAIRLGGELDAANRPMQLTI